MVTAAVAAGPEVRPGCTAGGDFYAGCAARAMVALFGGGLAVRGRFRLGVTRFWRGMPHADEARPLTVRQRVAGGARCRPDVALSRRGWCPTACRAKKTGPRPRGACSITHVLTGFLRALPPHVATFYHFVFGRRRLIRLLEPAGRAGGRRRARTIVGSPDCWRSVLARDSACAILPEPMARPGFHGAPASPRASPDSRFSLRANGAMPALLTVHLAVVLALFVTLPYGKFAHAVFRAAALLFDAIEKRQPSAISLKLD